MEKPLPDPPTEQDKERACAPELAQHELLRKDLPRENLAAALDDFDGDEN